MFRILLTPLIFIFCSLAHASWSSYAYVSPETEDEFKIKVYVVPADKNGKMFFVRLSAVSFPSKQAWVITTSAPISPEEQNQRKRFWSEVLDTSGVESIIPLRPKGIPMFPSEDKEKTDKVYEMVVPASRVHRTYIYIDFPSPVHDGGYFYSVDIGSYVKDGK